MRCGCRACPTDVTVPCPSIAARVVTVNTQPGSFEGTLRHRYVCEPCYRESWVALVLTGTVREHILPDTHA